jgi:hypothetical protein
MVLVEQELQTAALAAGGGDPPTCKQQKNMTVPLGLLEHL